MKNTSVTAILVTYQPNPNMLAALLACLRPQVDKIIVVDNGSSAELVDDVQELMSHSDTLIKLKTNFGIGYAQNVGIKLAMEDPCCSHVLLSDQDSQPLPDMVDNLLAVLKSNEGCNIAAVGPTRVDKRTGVHSYFMANEKGLPFRYKPQVQTKTESLDVMFLIASGMLIPVSVIKHVGLMNEGYFIDQVDTEWCLRAREKGYQVLGALNAYMNHELGDKVQKLWFFGNRTATVHSPLRNYYIYRNTLLMLKERKVNFFWKIHFFTQLIKLGGYSLIMAPHRTSRLSKICAGIYDGLLGRDGICKE